MNLHNIAVAAARGSNHTDLMNITRWPIRLHHYRTKKGPKATTGRSFFPPSPNCFYWRLRMGYHTLGLKYRMIGIGMFLSAIIVFNYFLRIFPCPTGMVDLVMRNTAGAQVSSRSVWFEDGGQTALLLARRKQQLSGLFRRRHRAIDVLTTSQNSGQRS